MNTRPEQDAASDEHVAALTYLEKKVDPVMGPLLEEILRNVPPSLSSHAPTQRHDVF